MMTNVFEYLSSNEIMYHYYHSRDIKQPKTPLGVLLFTVCKITNDTIYNKKDRLANMLKQLAKVMTIVVAGSCIIHAVNLVHTAPNY